MAAYRKTLSWGASALLIVLWDGGALAAEWSVGGQVRERIAFDDNVRLVTENEEAVIASITTLDVDVGARAPATVLNANIRLDGNVFIGVDDLDSFDQHLVADGEHSIQRVTLSANAGFDRDTARTSEITDTGRTDVLAERIGLTLGSGVAYLVSEVDGIRVFSNYSDVSFDTDELTDHTFYGAGVGWARLLTEATKLDSFVTASRFETGTGSPVESTVYGAQIGITHAFSERLEIQVGAGVRHTSTDFVEAVGGSLVSRSQTDIGFTTDSRVSYRFERTTLEGSYVRDVSPSSAGQLLTKNTVSLSLRQRATPVITFSFRGLYQENESANLGANRANNDRTFWSVTPGARWAFLPDWTASASYRYRSNQSGGSGRRAVSNAVRMAVTYRLPAR